VLIIKREVRLRERRIGPYKYLAVDRARQGGKTIEKEERKRTEARKQREKNKEKKSRKRKNPKTV
jgi:hypothetical protein